MSNPEISVVTAITERGHLAPMGNGRAEWYMPEDLERFRRITTGHAVVIAAVTFDTILDALGKPLPNRTNIVVAPTGPLPDECITAKDLNEGLRLARELEHEEIFVMGDQQFYAEAYPHLTKLYLTIVKGNHDTNERFPSFRSDFEVQSSEVGRSGKFDYEFQALTRRKGATIEL